MERERKRRQRRRTFSAKERIADGLRQEEWMFDSWSVFETKAREDVIKDVLLNVEIREKQTVGGEIKGCVGRDLPFCQ